MKRVFLIVLDSVGIGAMEDAAEFGDAGVNTLRSASHGSCFHMPNMEKLGLFNIDGIDKLDITIEFDYTKKNVEIPSEVTSRAITAEEYAMKLVPSTIG